MIQFFRVMLFHNEKITKTVVALIGSMAVFSFKTRGRELRYIFRRERHYEFRAGFPMEAGIRTDRTGLRR